MRARATPLLLLLACGEPEQQLAISGRIISPEPSGRQGVTLLRSDQGASEATGCGAFAPMRTLQIPLDGGFEFDVVREETQSPAGVRCFRVDWEAEDQGHSSFTFSPVDSDVTLPPLPVWPGAPYLELDESGFDCGLPRCLAFGFSTAGPLQIPADPDFAFAPGQVFAEAYEARGLVWRETYLLVLLNDVSEGTFNVDWMEDRVGVSLRAGLVMTGVRYTRDRVGELISLYAEYRALGGPLAVDLKGPGAPLSRGAPCEGFDACPFTDGDFTPISLSGVDHVTIDLGRDADPNVVLIRGAWAGGDAMPSLVRLEGATEALPAVFNVLDTASITSDNLGIAQDGLSGVSRLDVRFLGLARARYVRLTLRDDNGPLPITRLAELSVFE